jgi:hypothetical protein
MAVLLTFSRAQLTSPNRRSGWTVKRYVARITDRF